MSVISSKSPAAADAPADSRSRSLGSDLFTGGRGNYAACRDLSAPWIKGVFRFSYWIHAQSPGIEVGFPGIEVQSPGFHVGGYGDPASEYESIEFALFFFFSRSESMPKIMGGILKILFCGIP
jgi:hypothetical protein